MRLIKPHGSIYYLQFDQLLLVPKWMPSRADRCFLTFSVFHLTRQSRPLFNPERLLAKECSSSVVPVLRRGHGRCPIQATGGSRNSVSALKKTRTAYGLPQTSSLPRVQSKQNQANRFWGNDAVNLHLSSSRSLEIARTTSVPLENSRLSASNISSIASWAQPNHTTA